jgi:hypothetical protein
MMIWSSAIQNSVEAKDIVTPEVDREPPAGSDAIELRNRC